eukprot:19663-Hanusia_phi.AAC.3
MRRARRRRGGGCGGEEDEEFKEKVEAGKGREEEVEEQLEKEITRSYLVTRFWPSGMSMNSEK